MKCFISYSQFQAKSEKNKPNGYVGLNANGKIDLNRLPTLSTTWNSITSRPTSLSGYGITDGLTNNSSLNWNNVTNTPTTLSGYGIGDAQQDFYSSVKIDSIKAGSYLTAAYGAGKFITVNYSTTFGGSHVLVSKDGVNWDSATTLFMRDVINVRFVNNLFFAIPMNLLVGRSDSLAYSVDGYNWSKASLGTTSAGMYGIAYGNGRYVVCGSNIGNRISWSNDGISWTPASPSVSFNSVIFAFGRFIATSSNGIMHSLDGLSWTVSVSSGSYSHFCYGDRMLIAVSTNGTYLISKNGTTWTTPITTGINWSSGLRSIAYGNGRYVAVRASSNNNIFVSTDGLNWTNRSLNESWANPLYSVYGNGKFVINNGLRVLTLGSLIEPIDY